MTTPRWSRATPYGRLYATPGAPTVEDVEEGVQTGALVPSVTNVIGIADKPHLRTWYAKMAAECAVDTAHQHPGLIQDKPRQAVDYFKKAAERHTNAAASLGDTVHTICENLALGNDPGPIPENAEPYVQAWRQFRDDFNVEFTHVESTCFGTVPTAGALGYAGTADFLARINGLQVIGDLKTGRSVHTEAALQASALAHCDTLITPDDEIAEMPTIDAGIVVHLTPRGYRIHQTELHGQPWDVFTGLRYLWWPHMQHVTSRGPQYLTSPLDGASDIRPDNPAR